jgi:hypothetical protein
MNNIKNKIPLEECQFCIVIDKDSDYYKQVVFTHCKEGNYWVCDNKTSYLEKDLLPIIGNNFSFECDGEIITATATDYFHIYEQIEFDEYEVKLEEILLDYSKNKLLNYNHY